MGSPAHIAEAQTAASFANKSTSPPTTAAIVLAPTLCCTCFVVCIKTYLHRYVATSAALLNAKQATATLIRRMRFGIPPMHANDTKTESDLA